MQNSTTYEDITIKEVIEVLWSGKITIIVITFLFAIFSVYYALSLPDKYTSVALLKVNNSDDTSALSGLASQYGGLASMAGISLPSGGQDKSAYVISSMQSRGFVQHVISFDGLKENLIAAKSFDPETNQITFNQKFYDPLEKKWIREANKNRKTIPSYLEVHEKLKKDLRINQNKESGFISISFEHVSPIFAAEFIDLIVVEMNRVGKAKDLKEADAALLYLKEQSININNAPLLKSINSLIESQMNTKMFANIRDEYLIEYIDKPFIPEKKTSPTRSVLCIFITIFGGLISSIWVLSRHYIFTKLNQ